MEALLPDEDWALKGKIEDGGITMLDEFKAVMRDCPYMMDLDSAGKKQDGEVESEAVGKFTPMWEMLRFDNKTLDKTLALRAFKNLLQSTMITRSKNQGHEPTHLDMSGGKFYIPEALPGESKTLTEETFLNLLSAAYLQNAKFWFIELRTPRFRLFMDLDFKQPSTLPAVKIEAVVWVVASTIKRFFPERDRNDSLFRVICCTTTYKQELCSACKCSEASCEMRPSLACDACNGTGCTGKSSRDSTKPCEKCGGNYSVKQKTGVHLLWPEIIVETAHCMDIRESVMADLIVKFGHRVSPFNDWSDVVDASVYNKSGLRMLGARKCEPCGSCKSKKAAQTCTKCEGLGRIDQGRPYAPLFVTDGSGRRDMEKEAFYQNNYEKLMLDTKIRTSAEKITDGFKIPDGAPTAEQMMLKTTAGTKRPRTMPAPKGQRINLDSEIISELTSFFRVHPTTEYRELALSNVIKSSKRGDGDSCYIINVLGPNCTFCQNKGSAHRSNRIFFRATPDGICQCCHDTSDVPERYGLCKDFKSAKIALPTKLKTLLFGEEEKSALEKVNDADPTLMIGSTFTTSKVTEMDFTTEAKLRSVMDAANRLSEDLYKVEWTTSERFARAHGDGMRLVKIRDSVQRHEEATGRKAALYKTFFPDALGNGQLEFKTLVELGLAKEDDDEEEDDAGAGLEPQQQQPQRRKQEHLAELRREILTVTRNIVGAALTSSEDITARLRKLGLRAFQKTLKTSSSGNLAKKARIKGGSLEDQLEFV